MISDMRSSGRPVISGESQRSALGWLTSALRAWMMGWSTLCKFAGDAELDGARNTLGGCAGVQRHYQAAEIC